MIQWDSEEMELEGFTPQVAQQKWNKVHMRPGEQYLWHHFCLNWKQKCTKCEIKLKNRSATFFHIQKQRTLKNSKYKASFICVDVV